MDQGSIDKHSAFLKRYSILIDDIKYLKGRQWTITYYLLLLYAATIGFYKLMGFEQGGDHCFEKTLLSILTLLIAMLGSVYQFQFQSGITRYRKLLRATLDYLPDSFRHFELKCLRVRFRNEDKYTSWWNGFWLFTFPFIMIFWIGAAFILWYFFH